MNDFFLKFDNEEQANSILFKEEKQVFKNTDIIGTIYVPSMSFDEEGNVIMEALSGYHVNIRALEDENTDILLPFIVVPRNPVRVWG